MPRKTNKTSKTASKNKTAPKSTYESIAERILADLESGKELVWRQSWDYVQQSSSIMNPISGVHYQGMNVVLLVWAMLIEGWESPYFATFNQIKECGGHVIKGAKSVPLVKYFPVFEKDAAGNATEKVSFLRPSTFYVFNLAAQTEGIEIPATPVAPVLRETERIAACESIWQAYSDKPAARYWIDNKAYYDPSIDEITMPPKGSFVSDEMFYAILFHEAGHSTGHAKRLNRDLSGKFGSKPYAIEELTAEFCAAMLCGVAQIETKTIENHSAYVKNWATVIKQDPEILVKAIKAAMNAADYMLKRGDYAPNSSGVAAPEKSEVAE